MIIRPELGTVDMFRQGVCHSANFDLDVSNALKIHVCQDHPTAMYSTKSGTYHPSCRYLGWSGWVAGLGAFVGGTGIPLGMTPTLKLCASSIPVSKRKGHRIEANLQGQVRSRFLPVPKGPKYPNTRYVWSLY